MLQKGTKRTPKAISPADSKAAETTAWLQAEFPRATVQWKLHHASFLVAQKIFAFTRPEGIVLKLPTARIEALLETRDASFLVMGKRVMREWVLIRYPEPKGWLRDRDLLEEALAFVGSKAAGRSRR